ncbi:acetylornithine deacetylase [Fluoribacter dumoffii]|uniref:Acetylornithine deacetylase n=1 Tax=Fluoribacter dumoffii TaxID=463 RepID=A0A377GBT4_9GAMM|nr:acetylornithine deacetylase [Fluoribacter dumoffii]KTC90515.1 acetylornithine deacetylase [Fluoribacter dumoffii NY 23]MCW8386194.1 acetylornithine deacetylase [Fluoribacter dumoffii]MCW8419245.1 acetylornithine deacetylase [Fluoribacter dumoffii]MCW8452880.1 acetylornithine deacetylase [Fluoribacter dumoffii]MCW8483347.1 acetylornithine deacetylase [Fluoribacter dumoffii]
MDALDWLKKLISFDTTSRNSNLSLIETLANAFTDYQINPILIHDEQAPKANLLASIPDCHGRFNGGLILSGHTDVVPVDGQTWDSDPFQATIREGKIYGRGACDMKGFIAVAMSLIPQLKALHLQFPVHFAFSYDEEIGCRGAPSLIERMVKLNYKPKACIVGEPTSMQPVIGHKGIQCYRCQIHGVAAHSSLTPQGCNAIEHAASFISYLRNIACQFKAQGHRDEAYDVPYSTLSTNLIHGGNAYNTIPALCEFVFEIRNLVVDNPHELHQQIVDYIDTQLLPALHKEQKNTKVILETISEAPGLDTPISEPLVRAAQSICQNEKHLKVAYATEAGLFQQAQIPTIVCGPGSIEQAHRANEFVSLEQLELCRQFIIKMMKSPFLNMSEL